MDLKMLGDFLALLGAATGFLGMGVSYYFFRGQNHSLRAHKQLLESRLRVIEQEYSASKESSVLLRQIIARERDSLVQNVKERRRRLALYKRAVEKLRARAQSSAANDSMLRKKIAKYSSYVASLQKRIQASEDTIQLMRQALRVSRELDKVVRSEAESPVYEPLKSKLKQAAGADSGKSQGGVSGDASTGSKKIQRERSAFRPDVYISTAGILADTINKIVAGTREDSPDGKIREEDRFWVFGYAVAAFSIFLDEGYFNPENRRMEFFHDERDLLESIFECFRCLPDDAVLFVAMAKFYGFASERLQAGAGFERFGATFHSSRVTSEVRRQFRENPGIYSRYDRDAALNLYNQPLQNPGRKRRS